VADPRHPKGLIDTSVVIDMERIDPADLPIEIAISACAHFRLNEGLSTLALTTTRLERLGSSTITSVYDGSKSSGWTENPKPLPALLHAVHVIVLSLG
jgi:hypothetical protein